MEDLFMNKDKKIKELEIGLKDHNRYDLGSGRSSLSVPNNFDIAYKLNEVIRKINSLNRGATDFSENNTSLLTEKELVEIIAQVGFTSDSELLSGLAFTARVTPAAAKAIAKHLISKFNIGTK